MFNPSENEEEIKRQKEQAMAEDPLEFGNDTKSGMAFGLFVAVALIITAYSGTDNGNAVKKFFCDIADAICKNLFGANEHTSKSALSCASAGIFSLFTVSGMGLGGAIASAPRRLNGPQ